MALHALATTWHVILQRTPHRLFRIAATKRAQLTAITQNGHLGPHVNPSALESPTGSCHGGTFETFSSNFKMI